MGIKLLWVGATLILCTSLLHIPAQLIVGQISMIVGAVLLLFNK